MAMIKCPECGREISDKASFCPHCGAPVTVEKVIPITFARKKKFIGWGIEIDVVIDGVLAGVAYNGQSFTTEITTGSHQIQLLLRNANVGVHGFQDTLKIPADANEVYFEMVIANGGAQVTAVQIR